MDETPIRPRILLADDEAMIRDLVQQALEDAGYEVTSVQTAADAIAALDQSADYAGVVSDINFPSQPDGWAVATHAREAKPDVAIVYISGDSAHLWSAHGVPDSVMVAKPFALSQIVVALASQLNRADGAGRG